MQPIIFNNKHLAAKNALSSGKMRGSTLHGEMSSFNQRNDSKILIISDHNCLIKGPLNE